MNETSSLLLASLGYFWSNYGVLGILIALFAVGIIVYFFVENSKTLPNRYSPETGYIPHDQDLTRTTHPSIQKGTIRPKSQIAYVLFAWFFGGLGFHNFYALRMRNARAQFLMAILSFGLLIPICWIWALVEICVVDRDGRGVPMQ